MATNKVNMGFVCWNYIGLSTSNPYTRSVMKNNDLIVIAEHWQFENKIKELGEISNGFDYVGRASRFSGAEQYGKGRGQGGVSLLWRKDIRGYLLEVISNMIGCVG